MEPLHPSNPSVPEATDTTPSKTIPRHRWNRATRRRRLLILAGALGLTLLGVALFYAFRNEPASGHTHAPGEAYYTCPMHPQVVRDGPGDCPVCGMQLVRKTSVAAPAPPHPGVTGQPQMPGGVALSPSERVLANVATAIAERRHLAPELSVVGRITIAESRIRAVSATVSGRVEALSVTYAGQSVRAGQALLRLYSPELLAAQQEYLAMRRSLSALDGASAETKAQAEAIAAGAAQRLRLLGQTPAQIAALAQRGATGTAATVVAPFGGTVIRQAVALGQYVGQGQPLLWLVPLDPVWVIAEVYEQDLPLVRVGTRLAFTGDAFAGRELAARVEFLDPFVDPATRTVRLRASVRNPGGLLRPGMFVRGRVLGTERLTDGVAVPASAVIETGDRAVVWVATQPGAFEPRDVRLGVRADGYVEVLEGLREGERVATSGAFLLDSESQLRQSGAMEGMAH